MTQHITLSDFFTPIPKAAIEPKKESKDIFDHITNYTETSSGAGDFFRVGNNIFSAAQQIISPTNPFSGVVGKAKNLFDTAGVGLSIPQVISDANSLRHSATDLMGAQQLPYYDPLRNKKIAQAAKKSFLDTMNLTGTVAQIALFLDSAKIFVMNALSLKIVDGTMNVTGVIGDTAELISEGFKLKSYESPEAKARSLPEYAKIQEKKKLSWMIIAKNVASIAMGLLSVGVLIFGVATTSLQAVSITLLGLSTLWLVMKLTSYFYNKVIVESPMNLSSKSV